MLQNAAVPLSTKTHYPNYIYTNIIKQMSDMHTKTNHMRKLTTIEMRCPRRAVRVWDKRQTTKCEHKQKTRHRTNPTYRQQIHLFGHLQKMSVNSLPHSAYTKLSSGYRSRGRSRKISRHNIRDTLQEENVMKLLCKQKQESSNYLYTGELW